MSLVPKSEYPKVYESGFGDHDPFLLSDKGRMLTAALKQAKEPMVLAVDGAWGSGKTYFLRAWSGAHDLDAKVVYFDAFERDYLDDPMASLVFAIESSSPTEDSKLSSFTKKLGKFVPFLGKAAINVASAGLANHVGDLGDALVDSVRTG